VQRRERTIIAVIGGSLAQDAGGAWRTTSFSEGDRFGALGDRLRVEAAVHLFREHRDALVLALGGKGQLADDPDVPPVASVIERELEERGVPAASIVTEQHSGTSYEQLLAIVEQLGRTPANAVYIVSNKYHLPRLLAMIDCAPGLERLADGGVELCDAEDVLLRHEPELWEDKIRAAYDSAPVRERIALEEKGVLDIREGTYALERAETITLRSATPEDSRRVWGIRADPATAAFSPRFDTAFEASDAWFRRKYFSGADNHCFVLVTRDEHVIGYCRYDHDAEAGHYVVSVAVDPAYCGRGLGSRLLSESWAALAPDKKVLAAIRRDNAASLRLFEKNGYTRVREDADNFYLERTP